jgi:hypothetical protein
MLTTSRVNADHFLRLDITSEGKFRNMRNTVRNDVSRTNIPRPVAGLNCMRRPASVYFEDTENPSVTTINSIPHQQQAETAGTALFRRHPKLVCHQTSNPYPRMHADCLPVMNSTWIEPPVALDDILS